MEHKKRPKSEEIRQAILTCLTLRLREDEAIKYLHSLGIGIQAAAYYKHKQKIKDDRFKRMRELANTGYIDYHLDAIATLDWVKKEMLTNYYKEKNPYKAVEILTQMVNLLPYFTEYIAETRGVMESKAILKPQSNTQDITSEIPS